jgi:hypothetical protein
MNRAKFLISSTILLLHINIFAQKQNYCQFLMVNVPDDIFLKLDSAYYRITGFSNVNAGNNVISIIDSKNYNFENGIYTFKGQGPHFPKLFFIYYNSNIFTFSDSNFNIILEEFIECIRLLDIFAVR